VVWKIFFIFHNIWDVILPIDFHIFQRGGPTTNQYTSQLFAMPGRWSIGAVQAYAGPIKGIEGLENHQEQSITTVQYVYSPTIIYAAMPI
jgi:hypothetical protein